MEHAHLFYQFKSIAPSGTVTQDDIREITEELQEDSRYKALDSKIILTSLHLIITPND